MPSEIQSLLLVVPFLVELVDQSIFCLRVAISSGRARSYLAVASSARQKARARRYGGDEDILHGETPPQNRINPSSLQGKKKHRMNKAKKKIMETAGVPF
jgi:hypothetical protein